MVQFPADHGLAPKAFVKCYVTLRLGMRYFDRDLAAGAQVGRAKNGGHSAPRHKGFEAVVIQMVPWL